MLQLSNPVMIMYTKIFIFYNIYVQKVLLKKNKINTSFKYQVQLPAA